MSAASQEYSGELLAFADDLRSRELLGTLGLSVERRIRKRTRKGVDYQGREFKEYSEAHAARRKRKGLPTDAVNLQFTLYGGSMDHLDHVVARDLSSVEVLFTSERAERIMRYHNVEGAGKSKVIRQNMGLSEQDEQDLRRLTGDFVDRLIRKHFS